MFTFTKITDLPFQEGDVGAHFGFPTGVSVQELRAHSISPGGKFCAGTATFTPTGMAPIGRGFILQNLRPPGTPPSWTVVPNFQLPTNWDDFSIRGVNDNGDISGFFFDRFDSVPLQRPYIKRFRRAPVEIKIPPGAPMPGGQIWDISNNLFFVGEYKDAQGDARGYRAKARPDGSISDFTDFLGVDRIKSFDNHRALLYVKGSSHFYQFGNGPCDGKVFNITTQFGTPPPPQIMMNGINASRFIVGFFGLASNRQGFIGQFKNNCTLDSSVFSHPSSPTDTRLFSISDDGVVVGTRGARSPFCMIARNS